MSEQQHNSVAFTKVVGPTVGKTGARFEWSFTIRHDDPDQIINQLKSFEDKLIKAGCIPFDAYVDQRRHERSEPAHEPAAKTNGHSQPTNLPWFNCEHLEGSKYKGKKYWKVMGDKSQFPVPIYEALKEAGWEVDSLDIDETYSLNGWRAYYEENERGFPKKVVKLERID